MLVAAIHICRRRNPVYSFSPHPLRLLFSNYGDLPELTLQLPETGLLLHSQRVGGGPWACHPQLPITCPSATRPSSHEALFYQLHSLKDSSATPNLSVEGLLGVHVALPRSSPSPSASFPESSPLPALAVCHPSVLMRGRDQQGRPLEFDRATCCASTFLPP